jgi:hypothetical protein
LLLIATHFSHQVVKQYFVFKVDDTDKWRAELNALASSVGLVTPQDIEEYKRKKEREEMIRNLQEKDRRNAKPATGASSTARSRLGTSNLQMASRCSTGRLNEPLLAGRRTRGSRGSRGGTMTGQKYVVNQNERDTWVR